MKNGEWFAGWETEFSLSQLQSLLQDAGIKPGTSFGHGY